MPVFRVHSLEMLYGVSPSDVAALSAVVLLMLLVAALARHFAPPE